MKPNKKYIIVPRFNLLRDEESVKRHIEENDYFGTVATILSLLKHQLATHSGTLPAQIEKSFSNLEKDLKFLQSNYKISPATGKRRATITNPKLKTRKLSQKAS